MWHWTGLEVKKVLGFDERTGISTVIMADSEKPEEVDFKDFRADGGIAEILLELRQTGSDKKTKQ
jgi:hypothetical protein